MIHETDLYAPVKHFLEARGFEVKSEVADCDVVACKDGSPTVIVELKTVFSLELVLQGIDRQKMSDDVYMAFPKPDTPGKRKNWRKRQRAIVDLCRRLGLGLLVIDLDRDISTQIDVLLDPAPYRPRKNVRRQTRLKREFLTRTGDPNMGGMTKKTIMTAYRQDVIRCAVLLMNGKALKVSEIKTAASVPRAASILQKNYYGWFERVERGIYRLTALGETAINQHFNADDD